LSGEASVFLRSAPIDLLTGSAAEFLGAIVVIVRLATAVVLSYGVAAASYPAILLPGCIGRCVALAVCCSVLFSPLLVSPDWPLLRFFASVAAVTVVVKLYDIQLDSRRGRRPGLVPFASFLANPFSLVRRRLADEPRPAASESLLRLGRGALGVSAGTALLIGLFHVDWEGYPFLVEHAGKVAAFYFALISGLDVVAALWWLSGGVARDYMDNPFIARTPADFWRRYNRPMQQFFWEDVFKPVGGLRAPVRATLLVFAVSAVLHEYIFGIAIGRIQGYQTAFFLLQGAATVATARVKARGWRAVPWTAGTLGFNLVSSVLFFASMNGIVPFYSRGLPAWLRDW
jgi:MBOAT, membrane-bound O-acyltransferase family